MEEQLLSGGFCLRLARPGDAPRLHELILALAEYERLSHLVTGNAAMLEHWLSGARPVIEAMLVERAGEAVGFALWYTTYSTFLAKPGIHLEDLFVRPEVRGRGLGKAMLKALAALAVERDCGRLEWHVLDWNAPAIDFYRSLGANLMPQWVLARMLQPECLMLTRQE
jgi:GNAT superfamily N-acetyltransferase